MFYRVSVLICTWQNVIALNCDSLSSECIINSLRLSGSYMHHQTNYHWFRYQLITNFNARSLSDTMLAFWWLYPWSINSVLDFSSNQNSTIILKMSSENGCYFVSVSVRWIDSIWTSWDLFSFELTDIDYTTFFSCVFKWPVEGVI